MLTVASRKHNLCTDHSHSLASQACISLIRSPVPSLLRDLKLPGVRLTRMLRVGWRCYFFPSPRKTIEFGLIEYSFSAFGLAELSLQLNIYTLRQCVYLDIIMRAV